MSLYNLLFGRETLTTLYLATLGFRENDVERLRNVFLSEDGSQIEIYTRTGGGNRESYPQAILTASPLYLGDCDDDGDETYATFTFKVPEEWREDVKALGNVLAHGIRREFVRHLAKTISREKSKEDLEADAYKAEGEALRRLRHVMANGHTFVPHDDYAMAEALKIAEGNDGKLRSCWGILPLVVTHKGQHQPYPNARDAEIKAHWSRLEVSYDWKIDEEYWKHCQERWSAIYPKAMAEIAENVDRHRKP